MMTFEDYQLQTSKTAKYPTGRTMGVFYTALGLSGEAGEVANKVSKIIRDDDFVVTSEKREELRSEIGDVLWYVSQLCTELKLNMEDVAKQNLNKLEDRYKRDKISGKGDIR